MRDEGQPTLTEEDRICADLRRIGLGSRFQRKKFEHLAPSEARDTVRDWAMRDGFRSDVLQGQGASIYGTTDAHELFMTLARATHLRGVKSRVIPMSLLVNEVSGAEISLVLLEARALFITPFYRSDYKAPLTDFQRLAVEDFLMERMDDGRAVFTISSDTLQVARGWWSSLLVRRLQVANVELKV